jgi:hypothetical protein
MKIESNALAPEKFNNLSELSENYNRIIIGDSRSHQGVDPMVLDKNSDFKTYNLAAPGMQTPFMYYSAKKFIDNHGAPKQIVVNISFYLLGGQQWMKDIYFKHYVPSIEEVLDSYSYKLRSLNESLKWYVQTHIPSLKYEGRITKVLSDITKLPTMYQESFKARKIMFDENYQGYLPRGYSHIKDNIKLSNWKMTLHNGYSLYIKYMERFFNLSNRYDTKIYIYEFPWPEAYKNHQNLKEVREYYSNLIQEVASKFPNVHYVTNETLFLPHKYFVDQLHLNSLGAQTLSSQLSLILNEKKD